MEGTTKMLILFSIGPVQEFIAQARRTRDLWFGSHLLSELSKAAAMELETCGGQLIFPSIPRERLEDEAAVRKLKVANKILGLMDATDNEGAKQIALKVREAVENKWKEYADQAKQLMERSVNPALWKRQVNDVLEFHAVWSVLDAKDHYADVLHATERLMEARKTLRDFQQNKPGKLLGEKKSSLDGGRESVLLEKEWSRYRRFGIKENETLDAISLVKRLSLRMEGHDHTFPSVCEMAFLPFRAVLDKNKPLQKKADQYMDFMQSKYGAALKKVDETLAIKRYDSRLFYLGRLQEVMKEAGVELSAEALQEIGERLNAIHNLATPSPYYAFMLCDGDRMGECLRNLTSYEDHQMFSVHLSDFAEAAGKIIEKHNGQLVYSGGDDVMAYMPVPVCLDVSDELRHCFRDMMGSALKEMKMEGLVRPPTLSVGIAIVHMLEPLEEVRQLAAGAEELAKVRRNEVAIHFQKRGGGDAMKISLSFDHAPVKRIKDFQNYYREGLFSAKFAYELRALYREYGRMKEQVPAMFADRTQVYELLRGEIERLVWKKKPEQADKEKIEQKLLRELYHCIDVDKEDALARMELLAEQLIVAVMLVKEGSV